MLETTCWLSEQVEFPKKLFGYFGASTGAVAALWAAADPSANVMAVVSRGERPEMTGPRLAKVHAPTLLIGRGNDDAVIDLNRQT